MTFTANFRGDDRPQVSTSIDTSLNISWSKGDEIGVYDGVAVQKFSLVSGAGTTEACFEGSVSKAPAYIAVYPFSEQIEVDSDGLDGFESPSFNNCLNKGAIAADGGRGDTTYGFASGIAGYNWNETARFRNCVNTGSLQSADKCYHIAGEDGSYDPDHGRCYWTHSSEYSGIRAKGDKDGYNEWLSVDTMNGADPAGLYVKALWISSPDGGFDLDF